MSNLEQLRNWFKEKGRVAVAFSGGVDSTLLAYVANETLQENSIALTADSESMPLQDRQSVERFVAKCKMNHKYIPTHEFANEGFRKNPENRCYFCKKELFTTLSDFAKLKNFSCIVDGTNTTELKGHRPGWRAIQELDFVHTPFVELGFSKKDIRAVLRELDLEVAERPSSACLSSRIPTGTRIEPKDLAMVDKAEESLRKLGFTQVRLRHHSDLARVQVIQEELMLAIELRNKIDAELKSLGYKFVTVDLKCYGEN